MKNSRPSFDYYGGVSHFLLSILYISQLHLVPRVWVSRELPEVELKCAVLFLSFHTAAFRFFTWKNCFHCLPGNRLQANNRFLARGKVPWTVPGCPQFLVNQTLLSRLCSVTVLIKKNHEFFFHSIFFVCA